MRNLDRTPVHDRAGKRDSRRSRWWWRIGFVLLLLVIAAGVGRAILPWAVRHHVNRTLDRSPLYRGQIGPVDIHLWRGAYSVRDVRISKTIGAVPVPLFAAERVDFAMQWDALVHGKAVGRVVMDKPQLNFVDAGEESGDQTGAGGPWLQMIDSLFPFRINKAVIRNGSIHFRAFETETPVDVYLTEVQATVDNLGNIRDDLAPLVATVRATGLAMDQAKFEFNMTLDPFSYRPSFDMAARLLGLDVTKINDLAMSYGNFDFENGWFDLVVEAQAKQGQLSGYAKPLFRDLKVFSLAGDLQEENVLQAFWQALVGAVTTLFKNVPRDQFGTVIPFSGDLSSSTNTDILATIGNVLRNAFIRAYLPRIEGAPRSVDGLSFQPPALDEAVAGDVL